MSLSEELEAIAVLARMRAGEGEELAALIVAEPESGLRVYLCAFTDGDSRSWLALHPDGRPVTDRSRLREAVSIAALCELAEELTGSLDEVEPRVASPAYLDAVGAASGAAFSEGMKQGTVAVEGLTAEVESNYKVELR